MKRRAITPSKILAVALSAGIGCSTSVRPDPPPAAADPKPPEPAPTAAVPDDGDPKLVALRTELEKEGHDKAFAREAHFRPLCDEEGYPLVGNVVRKAPPQFEPSAFCAEVRERKSRK